LAAAGVHEELGRRVVEQVGGAAFHQGDVVDDACGVRQQIADRGPGLSVLAEGALGPEQGGLVLEGGVHEREPLALQK
jgi:hypothetical protein